MERCIHGVERGHLLSWRAKAQHIQIMRGAADDFEKQKLLGPILNKWRRDAVLARPAAQVENRLRRRTQGQVLSQWHTTTLQSRQAAETDRQRLLRNVFTSWNDRLRTDFLQGQIDIRLKSNALHKWRLSSRSNAASVEHNRRVAHNTLQHWLAKAQNRHRSIEGAEETFEASQRRRTMAKGMDRMISIYNHHKDRHHHDSQPKGRGRDGDCNIPIPVNGWE